MKTWVKVVIGVVVVLAVIGFSARPLLIAYMTPSDTFDNTTSPAPPNYNNDYYWLATPEKEDGTDLIPPNVVREQDLTNKPVDVFFIHPTGYFGPGEWNSTMEKDKSEVQAVEFMLATIASAFNGCCRIFAPHFREAHIHSFGTDDRESGNKALDLAYEDVADAFEHYIKHENNGRPVMLVGHSQGTLIGKRLLQTHFEGKELEKRLVAAYLVGFWLPVERINNDFDNIGLCESEFQTGCIVSFDTYAEGGSKSGKLPIYEKDKWGINESGAGVCINPLSWTTTLDKVSADKHLGALPFEFLRSTSEMIMGKNAGRKYSELNPVVTEFSWAKCYEDGRLEIETQVDNAFSGNINGENKSMHVADFSLFYGNIRKNAIDRVNAYLATQ